MYLDIPSFCHDLSNLVGNFIYIQKDLKNLLKSFNAVLIYIFCDEMRPKIVKCRVQGNSSQLESEEIFLLLFINLRNIFPISPKF